MLINSLRIGILNIQLLNQRLMLTLQMISRYNWSLITSVEIWLDMADIVIFLLATVDHNRVFTNVISVHGVASVAGGIVVAVAALFFRAGVLLDWVFFVSFQTTFFIVFKSEFVKNSLRNELHDSWVEGFGKWNDMMEDLYSNNIHVVFVVFRFVLIVNKSQFLPKSKNLWISCHKIDGNLFTLKVHMLLLKTLEVLLEIWVLFEQLFNLAKVFIWISS